ncbi:MAG: bifunctional diaminohydroxyphosphoribosylaminopyrimidine deaminase/5-amino-6-(5-phosphoribosylamino)uracil reductase RibD [Planctomycetaceae bacterium]
MRHALELARRGIGFVEPNPPVGAVLVNDVGDCVGEGWHQRYGGDHAEVVALQAAGAAARGATLYVTLEPCCHFGKTPPCSRAVIAAGVRRVVAAVTDPNPQVAGGGLRELSAAGIEIEVGLLESEANALLAPFRKLIQHQRPWLIAKWAMTLDGKLASSTGDSRWISGEASRRLVHKLRGRMDAVLVGIGTALADDPLLTARPPGPRTALRIVVDSQARMPASSKLAATAREVPLLLAVGPSAEQARIAALESLGVEILPLPADAGGHVELSALLAELGRRRMTNVLVEGGAALFGSLFDQRLIDEVYAFASPKLIGGAAAPGPISGVGISDMNAAVRLRHAEIRVIEGDVLIHGRIDSTA